MKRSIDRDEFYYPENKDEYLEIASNVVFGRYRRNIDDNEILDESARKSDSLREAGELETSYDVEENGVKGLDDDRPVSYDLENNRVRRQVSATDESNLEDLRYKQLVFEDNAGDSDAGTIDLETLRKKNRPADVLEYKRFMKVHSRTFSFIMRTPYTINMNLGLNKFD